MKKLTLLTTIILLPIFAKAYDELETVDYVDINKYMGSWYEIAKIPNKFQRKCVASKATYSLKKNGSVEVINECTTKKAKRIKKVRGIAFVADQETNSKLKVGFAPIFKYFGWFSGDYYIMDLDQDYRYVLVGSPSRDYLWILSRTKTLDTNVIDYLIDVAQDSGYDVSRIKMSPVFKR